MTTAYTPIRSKERTVKGKSSISPPLSASKIIGFVVTSRISWIERRRDVVSTIDVSGLPLDVESVRLLSLYRQTLFFPHFS